MNTFLKTNFIKNKSITENIPITSLYANTYLADYYNISFIAKFLKLNSTNKYEILSNITGYERIQKQLWYIIIYNFTSISTNNTLTIQALLEEKQALKSLSHIYFNANWFEREIWDLCGVFFFNHPDLRRILTDYSFEGHPLNKTFPLMGYMEYLYSDEESRLIPSSVSLSQKFR